MSTSLLKVPMTNKVLSPLKFTLGNKKFIKFIYRKMGGLKAAMLESTDNDTPMAT